MQPSPYYLTLEDVALFFFADFTLISHLLKLADCCEDPPENVYEEDPEADLDSDSDLDSDTD